MSSRLHINPYKIITNGNMAGSLTSLATVIQQISMPSFTVSWAGTSPVGTIVVEVSNDYSRDAMGNTSNAGSWNALPFDVSGVTVTSMPVSGNTGSGFIDIRLTGAYAVRVRYVRASGTGTMQVTVNAKVS